MSFNLGWGNAICVRKAFTSQLPGHSVSFRLNEDNLNYPPHEGDEKLIRYTRDIIKRQTGKEFKYVFLVNGATGGVTIAMRAFERQHYVVALTRQAPYFPLYPGMIKAAGLRHAHSDAYGKPIHPENCFNPIILLDSPANPSGNEESADHYLGRYPVIWDAVYHSKVYTYGNYKAPECDVMVGSYSKLTGLNGIRTGWVATNSVSLAGRMQALITAEYCGLSSASTAVLLFMLKEYRWKGSWDNFETLGRKYLECNREEMAKLEKFLGQTPVPVNGMFYYAPMDKACKQLFEKSEVTWTSGSSLGATDDFGRLNVGQDCTLVRDAVKAILKNDKI